MQLRHRPVGAASAAGLVVVALLVTGSSAPADVPQVAPANQPNIVVIMVDDMSAEIADYMSAVQDLSASGVSFTNYFVANSLCCPSRATYLTGKYPHNSQVRGNYWPKGGFAKFYQHDEDASLAPYLTAAGYRTALIGKYLNEYDPAGDTDGVKAPDYPPAYVPPGWDEWFSTGWGYQEFDYQAVDSVDGVTRLVDYTGGMEENYFTDVMSDRAGDFISRAVDSAEAKPFFLSLTPFAVHSARQREDPQQPDSPHFPQAPRDRPDSPNRPAEWSEPDFPGGDCGESPNGGCDQVAYPDASWGSFNQPVTDPAKHLLTEPLTQEQLDGMQADHLERVQQAQAVNDLITSVRADLAAAGVADNTYLVFTSDNGFHLGEHALKQGKGTAYDHDVRVPLLVYPPGGTAARTESEIVQNADLLPTLLDLAGAPVPSDVDGVSLRPLIDDAPSRAPAWRPAPAWRRAAYVEYAGFQDRPDERGTVPQRIDPDAADVGEMPPYHALRAANYLYVDYSTLDDSPPKTGKAEYFDLRVDPYELHNIYRSLSHKQRSALNGALVAYDGCTGASCWQAGLDAPKR